MVTAVPDAAIDLVVTVPVATATGTVMVTVDEPPAVGQTVVMVVIGTVTTGLLVHPQPVAVTVAVYVRVVRPVGQTLT